MRFQNICFLLSIQIYIKSYFERENELLVISIESEIRMRRLGVQQEEIEFGKYKLGFPTAA